MMASLLDELLTETPFEVPIWLGAICEVLIRHDS